jgi:hypothetical protein
VTKLNVHTTGETTSILDNQKPPLLEKLAYPCGAGAVTTENGALDNEGGVDQTGQSIGLRSSGKPRTGTAGAAL